MTRCTDRRSFLRTTGALAVGAALAHWRPSRILAAATPPLSTPSAEKLGWSVSCQLYTFRRFSFYEALDMISKLGVRHVEPCDFLRLDPARVELTTSEALSPPLRQEMKLRMDDHGITMPNYYANVDTDKDAAVKTFEFAKEMGVQTIVAEPSPEAFDMIEDLCNRYEINLAVHNHPRSPESRYWNPDAVLEVCKDRGRRIGACCDSGHWVRSGLNPLECLQKMAGRIITFHLKDVGVSGKPETRDVPLGTGVADYAAVLKTLKQQGFQGVMSLEYEHDSPQLLAETQQCLAFIETTAAQLGG